jgi:DNA-binding LytR/AlgR family response regulator
MIVDKKTYNCIIVDDDEIDRLTVVSFCKHYSFLHIAGSFSSSEEALSFARQHPTDVLLLDIDMPGMSGLELRRQLDVIPACIYITAHPEFAVESFELSALDFLVKPLKAGRFAAAMERLENYLSMRSKASLLDYTLGGDTLFIKDGHEHFKIQLHEIIYLEALRDYTGVVTAKKKYCVLSSIGNLLGEKAFTSFVRIHRSYAVQKHFINKVTPKEVFVNEISLPVGRSYKEGLADLIK